MRGRRSPTATPRTRFADRKAQELKKTVKFRAPRTCQFFDSIAHTRSFVDRAVRTHDTPNTTMFRKTLVFATVLLAFAATHAEDAPKITHKVRRAAHFQATHRASRFRPPDDASVTAVVVAQSVAEIPENVFTKKNVFVTARDSS